MAKDPAFLFYPGDWQGGTMTMTRHLKGCYIDLLMAQFNSGPLSLEEIKTVLGTDQASWTVLSKKFTKTNDGLFFNERLEAEKAKRKAYNESRRKNKNNKSTSYDTTYDEHMMNHMENENRNENEIKKDGGVGEEKKRAKFHPPTLEEVQTYILEKNYSTVNADSFFNFYASKNWFVGKNKMQDWHKAIAGWEARNKENLNQSKNNANGAKQSNSNSTSQHDQLNSIYASVKQAVTGN